MKAIVFALRGCSAGWLGAYGNEWVATPHLDRLAAEGVVFDQHISDRPESHAFRLAPQPHSVFVRANHPDTDAPSEFYAAWGEVFDARPQPDDDSPLDSLRRSFPRLLDRLADVPDWLIWIETDRLLPPWDVPQDVFEAYAEDPEEETPHESDVEYEDEEATPEPEEAEAVTPWFDPPPGPFDIGDTAAREWLHASFAAVVTKLDAELGDLFEQLRARGLDASATWIVTSDFGYPLGEHGHIGPQHLHEELIHLPLIVRLPGGAEAGRHIAAFTQPADLEALTRGELVAGREFAISVKEGEAAIRTPEWALVVPAEGEPMLFEKPDDRWEVNDLRARNVELAEELEARLKTEISPPT